MIHEHYSIDIGYNDDKNKIEWAEIALSGKPLDECEPSDRELLERGLKHYGTAFMLRGLGAVEIRQIYERGITPENLYDALKPKTDKRSLKDAYTDACNAYRDALNEMWETDGYWLDEDFWWFDVADCIIGISEVRELVDRKVDFDTFLAWYDYDEQINYALEMGKDTHRINLHSWLNGFPEEKKVPKEQRDEWVNEYWERLGKVIEKQQKI